jgi:indoleamine 2,3-dioxygenase
MVNWRRIDPQGPVAVGNLTLLQNFLGGMDEEWFVTLHINIEAIAGPALAALLPAQIAVTQEDDDTLIRQLLTIADTLQAMHDLLGRMPERCDPYIYYHRVRPFMFGWKDNPDLPQGIIYEGVAAYNNRPVQLRGETGAQSGIIPALDASLGIQHERDEMRVYLGEMRDYMPPRDRAFIEQVEQGPSIRAYIAARQPNAPQLREAYNLALEKLTQFRTRHIEFATLYILKPAQTTQAVGTGGTPFTFYLKKHIKETKAHLL